jgi:hypothetical protein
MMLQNQSEIRFSRYAKPIVKNSFSKKRFSWMIADGYNLPIWLGGIELELENAINQNQHSAVQ